MQRAFVFSGRTTRNMKCSLLQVLMRAYAVVVMLAVAALSPACASASTDARPTLNSESESRRIEQGVEDLKAGKYREALEIADMLLQTSPNSLGGHVLHGYAELGIGDKNAALADFDVAVTLEPKATEFQLQRCFVLYELHRLDEAIASCTRVIELDDKNVAAYDERALALDAKDDTVHEAQAVFDVDKSIELDASSA